MPQPRLRSDERSVTVDRYRRALTERVSAVDWRADLALGGRVAATALLAASGYAFAWVEVTSAPAVSLTDIALGTACVLSSVGLFAGALRFSGARSPWLGGVYVAGFTVLAGVWLLFFRGLESVSPTTWMGAAGCAAIIYAMGDGHPTRHQVSDAHRAPER